MNLKFAKIVELGWWQDYLGVQQISTSQN